MSSFGILGGAFNPPHIGHLVLAQEAASQLELERVLLVPTGEAPHKTIEPEPGPEVRLEMTRMSTANDAKLEVIDWEVATEGPSYTYLTLERLLEFHPDDEMWLLMGADMAASLESWERPERVVELARIGIAARPGTAITEAEAALGRLGVRERAEVVQMPELDVSSTGIRERVASGRPTRYLIPEGVREAIERRGLYHEAVTAR
jgi:nicotinate-nucleotide adenylyltransferase